MACAPGLASAMVRRDGEGELAAGSTWSWLWLLGVERHSSCVLAILDVDEFDTSNFAEVHT